MSTYAVICRCIQLLRILFQVMAVAQFSGLSPLKVSKKKGHKKKGHKKGHKKTKNQASAILRAVAHTQGVRAGNNGGISIDPNSPWTKIFREIYSERTVNGPKRRKGQQHGSGLNILQTIGGLVSAIPQIAVGLLSSLLG